MPERLRDRIAELPKGQGYPYSTRRTDEIDAIVIHHSATRPVRDNALAFARFHTIDRGWPAIGYHYVVNPDGTIDKCQPVTAVSYHATSANRNAIGVCLVGSFDYQRPSKIQLDAAIRLCRDICKAIPKIEKIIGHTDVPGTTKSCPGKLFPMAEFRKAVLG